MSGIAVDLTEAGLERWLLSGYVQMRLIPNAESAEVGFSRNSFFGYELRDGGGKHAKLLQKLERRTIPENGQQHGRDSKMAEEG